AAQNNQQNPTTILVTMTVGGLTLFTASPNILNFSAQLGATQGSPAAMPAVISAGGQSLTYNVTATTYNGRNWLIPFTSSGSTAFGTSNPTPLLIGVNPAGLLTGTYFGEIFVQSTTTPDSIAIAVVLTVGSAANTTVSPLTLQPFLYQAGSTPSTAQL